MSRVLVIGAYPRSLINFRGPLLAALVAQGHDVIAMSADADAPERDALTALGVSFRPFPVDRTGLSPLADLRTYLALRRAMTNLRPDVVLAYTIKPVVWGGFAARARRSTRFYALITGLGYTFHGASWARRALSAGITRLYRAALANAVRVIFQNSDNRDAFVARGIVQAAKCAVVDGSGVDLERFVVTPLPRTGTVFLTIGRLLGEKGFREYAAAARIVRAKFPDVVFRLVGPEDSSPDAIPRAEIEGWVRNGWVEWLGAVDDVREAIASCHVFVLPSYHEGLPRTVIEAMAMGRPVVTTDTPGCRETVVPGENGFLVRSRDANGLAERLLWLVEHRSEWQRMGMRSRELAEARFDARLVTGRLLDLLELR